MKWVCVFFVGSMLCPFLEDHKEDILCGPVWLAGGLDLSGHAGMLSLTSPKLVKGSNFHIYVKSVTDSWPFWWLCAQNDAIKNHQWSLSVSHLSCSSFYCRHGRREVPLFPGSHQGSEWQGCRGEPPAFVKNAQCQASGHQSPLTVYPAATGSGLQGTHSQLLVLGEGKKTLPWLCFNPFPFVGWLVY